MSERTFDLLSLGELLLRLSPSFNERLIRGETFQKQVGGAELNVAVGASLLGLHTGSITRLPSHDIGKFVKNKVRSYGISDDYFVYDDSADARMGLYYYEGGAHPRKPKVIYDRKNSSFLGITLEEFPESMYSASKCFHTTGITLALGENTRRTAIEMMKRFKATGTMISFDVNFRRSLWTGQEARDCIEQILPWVDILFCSEDTARLTFLKTGTVQEIMRSFTEEYPISVVASTQRTVRSPKSHTFGSIIYDAAKKTYYEEEPYRNIEVVDRIGSGDAYISGALYGLLSSGGDCQKAVACGNATAALKNTIPGDLPASDLQEMNIIIRGHKMVGPQSEMSR